MVEIWEKVDGLVGLAFIPNPYNKPQINHKNGIKTDNRAVNLEWANDKDQQQHAFKIGLNKNEKGEKHNSAKLTNEVIIKCKEFRQKGWTYQKITDYVNNILKIKVGRTAINDALLGRNWSHLKQ